jgi:DNA repair protein RadC
MPRKPSRIRNANDVYNAFWDIALYKEERVYTILLDGESVLGIEEIARGSETFVDAHPKQVFRSAIQRKCKSLILVHNHPSGTPFPSDNDRKATRDLHGGWDRDIGIDLQYSVIIAIGGYYSFRESGALQAWRERK